MADELQESREIRSGLRVKEFLESDEWKAAKERYVRELDEEDERANTNDARTSVWASKRALRKMEEKLSGTVQRGEQAAHQKRTREAGRPSR